MSDSQNEFQEENFIGKLLRETIETQSATEPQGELNFDIYFEKKLINEDKFYNNIDRAKSEAEIADKKSEFILYLVNQKIPHFKGEYKNDLKCYRFSINDQLIDFPQNWSLFENIHTHSITSTPLAPFRISPSTDIDSLLLALSSILPNLQEMAIFPFNEELYFVPFFNGAELGDEMVAKFEL